MDTGLNLAGYLEPVVKLAAHLRAWARMYLEPADANRVVRVTLGDLFALAANAWSTEAGPWAEAVTLCGAYMMKSPKMFDGDDFLVTGGPPHVPDMQELNDLCSTYACTYELAYLARWTIAERSEVIMQLRAYDLLTANSYIIASYLNSSEPAIIPLRCAVHAFDRHVSGSELVCMVTQDIERDELEKSAAWYERVKVLRGEV